MDNLPQHGKNAPNLFSPDRLVQHKRRARHTLSRAPYLVRDLEEVLCQRLPLSSLNASDILIVGCPGGIVEAHLKALMPRHLNPFDSVEAQGGPFPFYDQSFDVIIDGFVMHWMNDPLAYLAEMKRMLKPGGLYLGGFMGGRTLTELRQLLIETDLQVYEGAFARVSPMIKPEAATRLMQVAGFLNPVVDHEEVLVRYPDVPALIQDLRWMGEINAMVDQCPIPMRKTYLKTAQAMAERLFPSPDKSFSSTFDFVYMTGWCSL